MSCIWFIYRRTKRSSPKTEFHCNVRREVGLGRKICIANSRGMNVESLKFWKECVRVWTMKIKSSNGKSTQNLIYGKLLALTRSFEWMLGFSRRSDVCVCVFVRFFINFQCTSKLLTEFGTHCTCFQDETIRWLILIITKWYLYQKTRSSWNNSDGHTFFHQFSLLCVFFLSLLCSTIASTK